MVELTSGQGKHSLLVPQSARFPLPRFSDLPEKIRWAQDHDEEAQRMVKSANGFAAYACTWSGRRLYWALLLLKYQVAMAEPEAVEEPTQEQMCKNQ